MCYLTCASFGMSEKDTANPQPPTYGNVHCWHWNLRALKVQSPSLATGRTDLRMRVELEFSISSSRGRWANETSLEIRVAG